MTFGMREVLTRVFPTLTILVTLEWILRSAAIAVVGGLIGASYPAWLASRKDPVEARSYD